MHDDTTTLTQLRDMVRRFVDERNWNQFHTPKNLSMSLAIEAAELMEHFQWLTAEQSQAVADDPVVLHGVGEELADVLCYALAMANELGIDVSATMAAKMVKNAQKYPVDQYQGQWKIAGDAPRS